MFFTEEQIEELKPYRRSFETATRSGFARNVGSVALHKIEEVYNAALGQEYKYNRGCGVCVLGFLKLVGQKYLEDEAAYKELELKSVNDSVSGNSEEEIIDVATNSEEATAPKIKKTTKTKNANAKKTQKTAKTSTAK